MMLSPLPLCPNLAGDLVDVVAVHQLRRDGHGDQLTSAVVVLLSVAQLGYERKKTGD